MFTTSFQNYRSKPMWNCMLFACSTIVLFITHHFLEVFLDKRWVFYEILPFLTHTLKSDQGFYRKIYENSFDNILRNIWLVSINYHLLLIHGHKLRKNKREKFSHMNGLEIIINWYKYKRVTTRNVRQWPLHKKKTCPFVVRRRT